MKRFGLEKARRRLKEAFEAFEALERERSWESFETQWTRLLTSLNSVYCILEHSSKGAPKSEGWFSRVLGQRRSDELLSYLMHARNANDHGIAEVLRLEPGGVGIGSNRGGGAVIKNLKIGPGGRIENLEGWQLDGSPLEITVRAPRAVLVPVTDRGITYKPPESFLGSKLSDMTPMGVAKEALELMTILFDEAQDLVASNVAATR